MDTEGSQRQAAALNHLLGEIGLATDEQAAWWNFSVHEDLGGQTPTQAWLAGDADAVRAVVEKWYAATIDAQRRTAADPEMMAMLRRRLAELDERYPGRGQVRRSA